MIAWLNERISSIVRELEYNKFLTKQKKDKLEKELNILLEKRNKYLELTGNQNCNRKK